MESRLISRSIAIGETASGVVEHLGVLATHIDGDVGSRFTGALDFVGGDVGGRPTAISAVDWVGVPETTTCTVLEKKQPPSALGS